ncbi:MAG: nuclear transport factor 2 family protein [Croceibacterium sp.]
MVRNWVAALIGVAGIVAGGLVGPAVVGSTGTMAAPPGDPALADRIAVEDLVTRYYQNFGGDAAGQFGSYYIEDAVFDVNGVISTGRAEIEALYAAMDAGGDAPATQGTFHMIISNPVVDVAGDSATAQFLWTGVMNSDIKARPQLFEQGREYDKLVRQGGKWLIAKRVVIADSGLPERFAATYQPRKDYDITQ